MGSGVHLLGYFFTEHAKQLISRGILYSLIPKDEVELSSSLKSMSATGLL